MGRLSQIVFLTSIITSCTCYSIPTTKTNLVPEIPPIEPLETDFSDFPIEFMKKLIASLSPEELEELRTPTNLAESKDLVDRDGNTDKKPCSSYPDTQNYQRVKATDGEEYFVVTAPLEKYQSVIHYVCNKTVTDNKCEPANPIKNYGYCCQQQYNTTTQNVIPIPTRHLEIRNGDLYQNGVQIKNFTMEKKEVMFTSYCSCAQSLEAFSDSYTCPNPTHRLEFKV